MAKEEAGVDDDGGGFLQKSVPFLMVFGGCMSAVIAMEYVLKANPQAGNLLSLSEFAFVLLQSLPSRLEVNAHQFRRDAWSQATLGHALLAALGKLRLTPLKMPLSSHAQHAALWVSMSVLANVAFGFNISVPIHTLFRSCNVIASVLLGYALFRQRYTMKQLVCVVVITVGIFLGSVGDAKQFFGCTDCGGKGAGAAASSDDAGFMRWTFGIALLVFVQLLQGFLGHTQAHLYRLHCLRGTKGELAEEFLFTSHVVSFLPFIFLWSDVLAAARLAWNSAPLFDWLPIPSQLLYFLANNLCQLVCIKGVFRLSAHFTPLTVNITLSVRKFASVIVSILWFGNPWTVLHSVATVAIFGGVFAYSQCPAATKLPQDSKKKE
ncbi:slc35b4 [Symbiodinium microadriaticum]|nr:slc35b4 [Symbiodinium microadriaticum]CAE7766001.1 slc35b4 [Symbiodinium sp. KB8]